MDKRPPPNPDILTIEQIAAELQVAHETIRNWIKRGVLPAIKVGHVYRVKREDLDAMLAREQSSSRPLGTRRDPWAPETLGVPVRPREADRPPSVWDGTSRPVPTPKRA